MESKLKKNAEWFEEWFDSPYYHILYKNRDNKEAENFITNLINYLKPSHNSIFLDVACGKGRHSIYINKLGYIVDGFDLSKNSIQIAKKLENESLHFFTNDIRQPLRLNKYDYAFNLFTSFGYFDKNEDNQLSMSSIADSLKKNGVLVLDFMNSKKTINNLNTLEKKQIDTITFDIKKSFIDGYIVKDIHFHDKGKENHFQERVKAISLENFKSYFVSANLKIEAIFGDYNLNPFSEDDSDRLILVVKK
jgi:SAM-dependent methyltransferase